MTTVEQPAPTAEPTAQPEVVTPASPWMTTQEAAAYSRRHEQTVLKALRTYVATGGKRGLRGSQPSAGAHWRIRGADLDAWIDGLQPKKRRPT